MSMLAEKRRKQKWSLNPRGKLWSQDDSKFGQKLMEKMGWSHGKGLGAKENGMTEHIKVSYKNDSQGIGYKEKDDQWTEHESNFSALLESLGGGKTEASQLKLSSLEKKSQSSKARVHYQKFTRGKDLSRCSEKDLANIFGKKSLKDSKHLKQESETIEEKKRADADPNFSNAGLMSDYFKKKLPNLGKFDGFMIGNNGVLTKAEVSDAESESELAKPAFGFGFKEETTVVSNVKSSFISYVSEGSVNASTEKKKGKKKRSLDENAEETPSKKKKVEEPEQSSAKKKKQSKVHEYEGLSNPAFNPLSSTPIKIEKHFLEPIEESAAEQSLNDTVGEIGKQFEVQVQINNENTPVKITPSKEGKRKKNKTKKKQIQEGEESIVETPKKKKKSKLRTSDVNNSVTEDEGIKSSQKPEEELMDLSIISEEISVSDLSNGMDTNDKKKKKKKKQKSIDIDLHESNVDVKSAKMEKPTNGNASEGVDNPFFNMAIEEDSICLDPIENPYELKVKTKKQKKSSKDKENFEYENPVFDSAGNGTVDDISNEQFEVKRKEKKKKKKKDDGVGIDNPALNINTSIEESCDLILNVVATTPVHNSQENASEGSLRIKKVQATVRRKSVRFSDVTRERIIPTKEEINDETLDESRDIVEVEGKLNDGSNMSYIEKFIQKKLSKKKNKGIDNIGFNQRANNLEEDVAAVSKTIDAVQAEVENDINEARMKSVELEDIMVGEVGNPEGTNEILPDGTVKLKFKYASFKKKAKYFANLTGPKKSYSHLIKGDIVLDFKETNLHKLDGFGVTKPTS